MTVTPGRRLTGAPQAHEFEVGDYCLEKRTSTLRARLPTGQFIQLPVVGENNWRYREESDGTVTVHPSIDTKTETDAWHGWLRNGQWVSA